MRDRALSIGTLIGAYALLGIVTSAAPAQAQKLRSSLSVDLNLHYGTGSPHPACPPPQPVYEVREWHHHHHHWRRLPPPPPRHHVAYWDGPRHDRGRHLGWDHAPGHLRKEEYREEHHRHEH